MSKIKSFDHLSLNFNKKKRPKKQVKIIVFHYTGMQSEVASFNRLCDKRSKVSCHYFIYRNGNMEKIIPEEFVAWHAGKSSWKKYKSLNKYSIGIELVNPGHDFGYQEFSKKQINTLIKISKKLIAKYKIVDSNVVGHSDIAPLRKKDPGEKFPWKKLAKSKIGIWHKLKAGELRNARGKTIDSDKKNFFFQQIEIFHFFPLLEYFFPTSRQCILTSWQI